ncbi:branched-chain amino acid ABC transporter substrate-binding protein [Craterilacuibacter sp. RT1T]|uniref:branched-chain amino acid ABC transporter substrate-binding protein n=1 Tax=Craterilacuibacter sp. RT1T TaxID=2942211 RepID=UPI0020C114EB|nr:branched-chain amino acid ABC transporter substrate-binding protein [Craterilacuibacter sp. RT1T]MCL6263124.1 branched-chain amino acid ABC transporter substrate-binding protein [Craterilacuibacter sp. RT1T]
MAQQAFRKLHLVLALGGMMAPFAISAAHADSVVKLGFASPLSGPQAHYGKDNENAAKMAVDDLNKQNLVIGGQKVKFELVPEDDQADPRVGTQVAQRLVDSGVKAVIGHFNSGVSIPASRIYSDAGIPQLSVATNPAYTASGYKTAFRLVGSDSQIGGSLGQYAVRQLKAQRIAVIDDRTAYGQGIADEFVKSLAAQGKQPIKREYTNDKANDFTAILTSLKAQKPDVIFYGGADAQAAPMARQMKRLGLNARLMGGDMLNTPNFIKLAGTDATGHYSAVAGGELGARPAGKDFEQRYKARYQQDVVLLGPQFYDGVMIVADAMKRAGSTDPAKFLPYIAKTGYKGVTADFGFDAAGNLKNAPVTISSVENNDWKVKSVVQ